MSVLIKALAKIIGIFQLDDLLNRLMERFVYHSQSSNKTPMAGLRAPRRASRFQILIYHKVSPDSHPFFEALDPALFEKQVLFLKEFYNIVDLDTLVEGSQTGEIPSQAVAITFDDGYKDNYTFAFPVLQKHSIPATIFVTTGVVDDREVLWHDRVFDAFRFRTVDRAHVESWQGGEWILDSDTATRQMLELAIRRAKQLPGRERLRFVEEIEQALQPNLQSYSRVPMLTWEDIKEMQRFGIRFGSHTVSHPILSRIERDQLWRELIDSKKELESHLNVPITAFAYPNGQSSDYNDEVKKMLKAANYTYAVTTQPGFNTAYQDRFELRRGQPWQHDPELFRLNFFLQRHGLK